MTDASAKQEKLRLGHLALDYSETGRRLGREDCDAQLAPAITLGKMLPILPAQTADPRLRRSRYPCDKALRLDPDNDTAWHILGRWNRVLADVMR